MIKRPPGAEGVSRRRRVKRRSRGWGAPAGLIPTDSVDLLVDVSVPTDCELLEGALDSFHAFVQAPTAVEEGTEISRRLQALAEPSHLADLVGMKRWGERRRRSSAPDEIGDADGVCTLSVH
jgi:hypothetical protein